ncbi:hypothetical protein ACIXGO_04805 [Bacteroides fragilis]|jgi:hypothetical protein|nr:MAG TPA: hypothetical protein [Caudoviricetes sp.]
MKYINKSDMQGMIAIKAKALHLASSIDALVWIKHITGIDNSKKGGYSLIGSFVNNNQYQPDTVYIAKFERIESKHYTFNHYVLFLLTEDYEVRIKKVVLNVVVHGDNKDRICNTKLNWADELKEDVKTVL